MIVRRTGIAAAAAVFTMLCALAAQAHPAQAYPARHPVTRITLTLAAGESPVPVRHSAWLTCGPAGGTHRAASDACAALVAAGGDFTALTPTEGVLCTMQYDPVTVTARGRWQNRAVRFRRTFGNACVLSAETGAVFRL